MMLTLTVLLAAAPPAVVRPDFDRHVQPLLNRLGCNAGACHGAANAKGSFALSLFSASPAADHGEITRAARGRRIDHGRPADSLFLRKATGQLRHDGGARLKVGSWEYRLLLRWIEDGARRADGGDVVRLDVTPAEHLIADLKRPVSLRAVAEFADGTREDVTPFTDFRTPEPDVLQVGPGAEARALKPGFAPVLAFYRGRVVAARVLVAWPAAPGFTLPDPVNYIDREAFALLRRLNLPPTRPAGDAEFLRRVCLDVAGRLPAVEEVRAFVASADPDKRRKKIDELLDDPRHAALWATKLLQTLRMRPGHLRLTGQKDPRWVQMAHDWLRARVRDNVPVDRLLRDVLLATSREGRSPAAWVEQVRRLESADPFDTPYRERATLDLFWRRPDLGGGKYFEGMADTVAGAFLGVPLECATCHHHPLAAWGPADRRAFGLVFAQVRRGSSPEARDAIAEERSGRERAQREYVDRLAADVGGWVTEAGKEKVRQALRWELGRDTLSEVYLAPLRPGGSRILGGPAVTSGPDAREPLFRWMTAGTDPPLARAFVNRVWKHYFGRGLVEPDEVMVAANPPAAPALLDALTRDFVAGGYDLRRLERTILRSRTYQLSSVPAAGYEGDQWFPSRSRPFRVAFPVTLDMVADALGGHDGLFPGLPAGRRLIDVAVRPASVEPFAPAEGQERDEAMDRLFGRGETASRCREGGGWGVLHLYSRSFNDLIAKSKRVKAAVAEGRPTERALEELFLATLSRRPSAEEMRRMVEHVGKEGREGAMQDVLWALINSSEFIMRR